jgi:spore maturation protein CgeB
VPTYRDLAELREKIAWYLAHPEERQAAAARSRKRALAEHTYAHRAAEMLEFLLDRHAGTIQRKGVREQLSSAAMAAELEDGDPLRDWLLTIPPETPFTQDAISALIGGEFARRSYPENLFCYMREVRGFAETLFKEQR